MQNDDLHSDDTGTTRPADEPTSMDAAAAVQGRENKPGEARANLILDKLQPIVAASRSVVGGVQIVAFLFTVAAAGLVTLLVLSFNDITVWKLAVAGVLGIVLLIPAVTWWLLRAGLQAVINLPSQLMQVAGKGTAQLSSGVSSIASGTRRGFLARVTSVIKSLLDLKSTGLEGKLLVVESVALFRMFNPFTLILAVGTFAAGVLEMIVLLVVGFIQVVI